MPKFTKKKNRYEFHLMSIVELIHGEACGSSEGGLWGFSSPFLKESTDYLEKYKYVVKWLEWRISKGWFKDNSTYNDYDKCVRKLAKIAVDIGKRDIVRLEENRLERVKKK